MRRVMPSCSNGQMAARATSIEEAAAGKPARLSARTARVSGNRERIGR